MAWNRLEPVVQVSSTTATWRARGESGDWAFDRALTAVSLRLLANDQTGQRVSVQMTQHGDGGYDGVGAERGASYRNRSGVLSQRGAAPSPLRTRLRDLGTGFVRRNSSR